MKQKVLQYFVPGALCLMGVVMGVLDPSGVLRFIGWLLFFAGGFLAGKGGVK